MLACITWLLLICPVGELASQVKCGADRWSVKTLADPDADRVAKIASNTSISKLAEISIPEIPYPLNGRMEPHELRTYRLTATVSQILYETDKDWHIVLRDSITGQTMIAEIPSPECAANSAHAALYSAARDSLRRVPRGGMITIEGIGFFDFIHNQRGHSRNCFELHPVTLILPYRK